MTHTHDRAPARHSRPLLVGAALSATNFVAVFDNLVVTVALPAIQRDLGLRPLDAQWLVTAYALALGGFLLAGGRCGDRYGRRRMLVAGLATFVAGLLLAGLAWGPWPMLAGRILQGLGAAFAVPNSFALVSALRPEGRRRKVFASVTVAGGLGAAGGAVIGGLVTEGLGWRFVFLFTVPVAVATACVAARVLDTGVPGVPGVLARPDAIGAALSVAGIGALVFAVTNLGRAVILPLVVAAAGVVALVVLAVRERYAASPLVPRPLLRDRTLRAAVSALPGFVFVYDGTVFAGLLYLQRARGLSPFEAGLTFGPLGLAVLAGSPLAAFLLGRRPWPVVVACTQLTGAAGLVLLTANPAWFVPGLVLVGLGAAVSAVALNGAAGSTTGALDKGCGYGVSETVKYLSSAVVVATLASVASTQADPGSGYRLAFGVAALAGLAFGLVPPALTRKDRR